MPAVKSLAELKRLKEEALQKREATRTSGRVQVIVAMGTTGIAAGARETMRAVLEIVEQENLSDVLVRQTGNIGLDSWEPIVEVVVGEESKVTYGKVSAERARRIMKEHVMGGKVVSEYVIPA